MDLHFIVAVLIFTSVKTVLTEQSNRRTNQVPHHDQSLNHDRKDHFDKHEPADYGRQQSLASDLNDINRQDDEDVNTVPGVAGKDYPNYRTIPQTSFTCADKKSGGYYADMETGCQVFHVCNARGVKSSFICSPGSIFNQKYFVCDWWYDVECDNASDLYSLNDQLNRSEVGLGLNDPEPDLNYVNNHKYQPRDPHDNFNSVDLSLASSGFNAPGYHNSTDNSNERRYQNQHNDRTYQNQQSERTYQNQENVQSYQNEQNERSYQNQQDEQTYQNQQKERTYQNQQQDRVNFTWQPPSSQGEDINYVSSDSKDWRSNFEEKPRPSFQDFPFSSRNDQRLPDTLPRGFSKGSNSEGRPPNLNPTQENFERLQYGDQIHKNQQNQRNQFDFRQRSEVTEDGRKNVIFDQRERTNFVRPFVQNKKEDFFPRRPEAFGPPPQGGGESFGDFRERDSNFEPQGNQGNFERNFFEKKGDERSRSRVEGVRQEDQPGIIYADGKNDDDFERIQQKQIDEAMLCKHHSGNNVEPANLGNFGEGNGRGFEDVEANRLTYEKPPSLGESIYSQYNIANGQAQKEEGIAKPPFPPEQSFTNPTNERPLPSNHHRRPLKSRIRPTGGFRDGIGNGFPSLNRELVGSNTITGVNDPKSPLGQHPDYPPFGNQHVSQFGLDVNSLSQ